MDSNQIEIAEEAQLEHVDRISNLQDEALIKILSLLPTKYSVRTSALSTRWHHLYASVPILEFTNHHAHPEFHNFVTKTITAVTQKLSYISKLYINDHLSPPDDSIALSWIETAISNSVQELDVSLVLAGRDSVTPSSFFTSETLVFLSLDLKSIVLSVPDSVHLPNLIQLSLSSFALRDEESATRLFSGCPKLRDLSLNPWTFAKEVKVFKVSSPSLISFYFYTRENAELDFLVNCPKLRVLHCETQGVGGYSGDFLGSLEHCHIEAELDSEHLRLGKMRELVNQVCNVQFLALSGDTMEALLSPPCSLPTFGNLTALHLNSYYTEGWRLLPIILESSPLLRNLVFTRGFFERDESDNVPFLPPEHVPACLTSHLKVIAIDKFVGEEDEYKLVEYFLNNALVLETMKFRLWLMQEEDEPYVENDEGEVEVENKIKMEVEEEEEVEREEKAEGEVEGEDQEDEEEFESNLERHFEISRRLLAFKRYSEVCQIVILDPDEELE